MNHLMIYLLIINAAALLFMLTDKLKAINKSRRIPESILLGIGLFGGSVGCYLGMLLFRHKTQKPAFRAGLPAMLVLHGLAVLFLYRML